MKWSRFFTKSVLNKPNGVMWKESNFHKQKELEKKNPVFKIGGRR